MEWFWLIPATYGGVCLVLLALGAIVMGVSKFPPKEIPELSNEQVWKELMYLRGLSLFVGGLTLFIVGVTLVALTLWLLCDNPG